MLYVLTQDKTISIPINDNVVVYIKEAYISSGRLYDIIAKLNDTEYILGTYMSRETAREILISIHQGRACQDDMFTEMPGIYEGSEEKNDSKTD